MNMPAARPASNFYSIDYIAVRNSLINVAVKYTNKKVGTKPVKPKGMKKITPKIIEEWGAAWNLTYHRQMNKLYEEAIRNAKTRKGAVMGCES